MDHQHQSDADSVTHLSALQSVVNIVAAYVGHNSLRAADLPELIGSVHSAINRLSTPAVSAAAAQMTDNPAVSIKKSVTRDYIVCLEDGKKFKSLRRHLSSFHNLTPEAYRSKWNLGSDYPMVAPAYSATRSQLARESGLGQVTREAAAEVPAPEDAPKKAGRGRPRKVPPAT